MHLDVLLALRVGVDAHLLVPALQVHAVLSAAVVDVHQVRVVLLELWERKQELVRVYVLQIALSDLWRFAAEIVLESLDELVWVLEVSRSNGATCA